MKEIQLTADQEAQAERISKAVAEKMQQELRQIGRLLASKEDHELFGQTAPTPPRDPTPPGGGSPDLGERLIKLEDLSVRMHAAFHDN